MLALQQQLQLQQQQQQRFLMGAMAGMNFNSQQSMLAQQPQSFGFQPFQGNSLQNPFMQDRQLQRIQSQRIVVNTSIESSIESSIEICPLIPNSER